MRRFTFHDELSLKGKSSSSMTEVMANVIHAIKCLTCLSIRCKYSQRYENINPTPTKFLS